MLTFYDNNINLQFTQRKISTSLAEMSDLSPLWKLRKLYCAVSDVFDLTSIIT